ncbi:hypothetical protein EDD68_103181 [Melghiribacillus thermohalophilus]|uniref:Uncharacterized protein n=1 Tax=Melghiribacillus thermohalophilus TaxID=1324956 RepID=A0A4R3NEH1_9BACI|nr:hypothetical protein [Melghiribacillus thermohalophilus]TCT25626.1 hypothetical protein EDD68_103181 [Melghiribacillus thermohalophilus]
MKILSCSGSQLEKSSRTSPEDAFIRSQVTFQDGDREKTFSLLYLEYFDQKFAEFTPFQEDPIIQIGNKTYDFKDVAALAALLAHPEYVNRKREYVHDLVDFQGLMKKAGWDVVKQILMKLADGKEYEVKIESHLSK